MQARPPYGMPQQQQPPPPPPPPPTSNNYPNIPGYGAPPQTVMPPKSYPQGEAINQASSLTSSMPGNVYQGQYYQQSSIPAPLPQPPYTISSQPTIPNGTTASYASNYLATQMSGLSLSHPISSVGQPVGIIGQPLNLGDFRKVPTSPIMPQLDPEYFRITMTKVPKTSAALNKTKIPLGITVTPYPVKFQNTNSVPVIDGPIVRCRRCRTYLNPYVEIMDQGIPPNFDYDVATQQYVDRKNKAELNVPVYEFIAPMEYMVRPPQPPVYLFVLDVSYTAIKSGIFSTAIMIIRDSLDLLPNANNRTKIGFLTVDSTIHFYNLSATTEEPKMMVVSDLDDPFLPCIDDLLVELAESRPQIENLLAKMATFFSNTNDASSALGPALNVAIKLMAPIGGKIVLIQSTLPSIGEGKLTNREDLKLLGTSKENGLLQPANNYYKTLATECSRNQVCIDMFLFPSPYLDVASMSCAAKFTGGKVHLYRDFSPSLTESVEKFAGDMQTLLKDEIGLEAVIRIRASQGLSFNSYHGSFFLRSTDLLSIPNINSHHSYSAQISIDENVTSQIVCFQTAVLHTSCHGERRIRVINAAFPVSDDPKELMNCIDIGALSDLLFKMASEKVLADRLEDARDALNNKVIDILNAVKNVFQMNQNPQLLLTENLRLLPLVVLSILKSPCICPGNLTSTDYRSYTLALSKTLSVSDSGYFLIPYLFAVHAMTELVGVPHSETGELVIPPQLEVCSEVLERHGFYIMDDGMDFYIWIGSQAHPDLCQLILNKSFAELRSGRITMPHLENVWSKRIWAILSYLRGLHGNNPSTYLIKDDSEPQVKIAFLSHLIQDMTPGGQPSYASWVATLRDKTFSTK